MLDLETLDIRLEEFRVGEIEIKQLRKCGMDIIILGN
jgi:hypothetical protein